MRFPGNLGGPVVSAADRPEGLPNQKTPGPGLWVLDPRERRHDATVVQRRFRVHILKGTSRTETRPIGIPTLEDKIPLRAVVMLLEQNYERDFHPGLYRFRPTRSAHQALANLWQDTMASQGGWILDVDIRRFLHTLDHAHRRQFLQRRVRDGVLLRLIGKWLNAGVMEEANLWYPEAGSPQGGVISPLLGNVHLHYCAGRIAGAGGASSPSMSGFPSSATRMILPSGSRTKPMHDACMESYRNDSESMV